MNDLYVVDERGGIANRYRYDAFGNAIEKIPNARRSN
jgi:YD repeat-containing protein